MIRLTLPYPPSANRYWRHFGNRVVVSREAIQYRQVVALLRRNLEPMEGELIVSLDLFRERKVGDIDNRAKPLLDALQGLAYPNDAQIAELHIRRFEDKLDPRVEVTIARQG